MCDRRLDMLDVCVCNNNSELDSNVIEQFSAASQWIEDVEGMQSHRVWFCVISDGGNIATKKLKTQCLYPLHIGWLTIEQKDTGRS